jgi:hypothetical protein
MTVAEEMAAAREKIAPPSHEELLEQARWMVLHPDTAASQRPMLMALLREIDLRDLALKGLQAEALKQKWEKALESLALEEIENEAMREAIRRCREKGSVLDTARMQGWADRCGIALTDERIQDADKYGWPSDYGLYEAGWNAAMRAFAALADLEQALNERKET